MLDINELLSLDIDEFIKSVYKTFLGREADNAGYTHYLNEYNNGLSKEKIIFQVRASEEGIQRNYPIRDLNVKSISVDELLWREIGNFIEASYISILGRNADGEGYHGFYQSYAAGNVSKEEIIKVLRDSEEGKKIGVEIKGLKKVLIKRKVKRIILRLPLIGRLVACVRNLLNLERKMDARMNEIQQGIHNPQPVNVQQSFGSQSAEIARLQEQVEKLRNEVIIEKIQQRKVTEASMGVAYKEYEDKMRGTREEIKQRLNVYEAIINKVKANNGDKLFAVDLGCGRGEWLELLQENYQVKAIGVDSDASMLEDCEKNNLDAIQGDLCEYLRGMASESVDIITMFQVVEHLPIGILHEVLSEIHRVLRKGGAVILETPNPENMIIGACNFYFDPTHNRPIPPTLLKILVEATGMENAEVVRIHPYAAIEVNGINDAVSEGVAIKQMANFFNNYADYAVTAFKN